MEEAEIVQTERKLIMASLVMTGIFDGIILVATILLSEFLDWRISIGLILLSLLLQFGFVMPGIRNIVRGLRAKANNPEDDLSSDEADVNLEQGV